MRHLRLMLGDTEIQSFEKEYPLVRDIQLSPSDDTIYLLQPNGKLIRLAVTLTVVEEIQLPNDPLFFMFIGGTPYGIFAEKES